MSMANDLQNQIYETLNLKDTDELLDIWKTNDRSAWTNDAFLIIEKILKERLGSVPPQEIEVIKEEAEEEAEDDTGKTLVRVSSLADALSYILLIFIFLAGLIIAFSLLSANSLLSIIVIVGGALIGVFCFVILQFISKGILVLLDIRANTTLLVKRKEGAKNRN